MNSEVIIQSEEEIDREFSKNPLQNISYSQAIWTLLSVMEDKHLKMVHIDPLPEEQMHAATDVLINAVTHPIRALHFNNDTPSEAVKHILENDHYGWAHEWIDVAIVYDKFCSIFPLWHRGHIDISVSGNVLESSKWKSLPLEYEAYNRLIRKDGVAEQEPLDPNELVDILISNTTYDETTFELNLNPELVNILVEKYSKFSEARYTLPDTWMLSNFSFGEFKRVFITIQSILYGRFISRSVLAMRGMQGLGYPSSVWVVKTDELVSQLGSYTGLSIQLISKILDYLTFGAKGIRYPDIATQPLIDLKNGSYALSPFIWGNSNAERNLCVLLNQIEQEKPIYLNLTLDKETILREEISASVKSLGYDVEFGKLEDTDLDIAILDRDEQVCICFELKWFIEPAEVRELVDRTEELQKGVLQAKKIMAHYNDRNPKLLHDILDIDNDYEFHVAVGSRNWVGNFDAQSDDVPIIKIKHFIEKLQELGSLKQAAYWLNTREYLPKEGVDYEIVDIELKVGSWKAPWYGIKPINK